MFIWAILQNHFYFSWQYVHSSILYPQVETVCFYQSQTLKVGEKTGLFHWVFWEYLTDIFVLKSALVREDTSQKYSWLRLASFFKFEGLYFLLFITWRMILRDRWGARQLHYRGSYTILWILIQLSWLLRCGDRISDFEFNFRILVSIMRALD